MGNVILGLLLLAPQTLYSLNQQFRHGISLFYRASYGSLQSALRTLAAKEYVTFAETVEGGRNKKVYSITDAGAEAFHAWMRAPIEGSDIEVAALSKLYFLGLVDQPEERRAVLDDVIAAIERDRAQLASLDAALDEMDVPEQYRRVFHYQRKALAYGLMSTDAAEGWFRALAADETGGAETGGEETGEGR